MTPPLPRVWWLILALGMGLRLLWAGLIPVEPVSDSHAYLVLARTWAEHGVYGWDADTPSAYWAVGTGAIAAATFILFGNSFVGIVALNLLAGLMIIILTHALARRWFGSAVAIVAMGVVAVWPNLIFFTSILSSELYFIALILAGLWFWQRPAGRWWVNLVLAGVIWGLACYVRPLALLVPVTLALVDLPRPRQFLVTAAQAAVAVALIVAVVSPWTLRNAQVMGAPVLVSTNFGPNLWMGNNPDTDGGYMPLPDHVKGLSEVERAALLEEEAKAYIKAHPGQALARFARNLIKLNDRETIGVQWNGAAINRLGGDLAVTGAKALATLYWLAVLGAGLAGIAVLGVRFGWISAFFNPPVALWGYFTTVHIIIVVQDRYHMPSSAYVGVMAAIALAALLRRPIKDFRS